MRQISIANKSFLMELSKNDIYPEEKFSTIRFISNSSSEYKLIRPENYISDLLIVCDDVSNPKMESAHKYKFFNRDDAKRILDFVEKYKNHIQTLIVACEAGISRSSGCAAALGKIYLDDDTFVFDNARYYPNRLIYHTILDLYYNKPVIDSSDESISDF